MNANAENQKAVVMGGGLAVLSVATFWLLPIGPIISAFALRTTKGLKGWSRRLALTGSLLCVAWGVVIFSLFGMALWEALTNAA